MLVIAGIAFAILAVVFLGLLLLGWGNLTKLGRVGEVTYVAWLVLFSLYFFTQETWLYIVTLIPLAVVATMILALKLLGKVKFSKN